MVGGKGFTAVRVLGLGLLSGEGGCLAKGAWGCFGGGGLGVGIRMLVPLLDFLLRGLSFVCALRSASTRFCCSACCAIAVQVLSIIVRSKANCASASANS